jgi:hypothetical protein
MSNTIDKKLLEHILTDRIESYQKIQRDLYQGDRNLHWENGELKYYDDYEYLKILETRIHSMYHVIEILNDTKTWIRNMGDVKLEKLGLNIEDYE